MERKFKELKEAQEVLSDPDKRKKYDRHGSQWEQAEAFEQARQEGLTRYIGITGDGVDAPKIYLEALRRFDFD